VSGSQVDWSVLFSRFIKQLLTLSTRIIEFIFVAQRVDVSLQPWTIDSSVDGVKSRHISYTLPLNYSIGPKTSAMKERQVCHV
jgi:hypothetical protein